MRRSTALPAAALFAAAFLAGALAGCSAGPGGATDGGAGADVPVDGPDVTSTLARSVTGATDLRRLVVSDGPEGYARLASPPFGAVTLQRLLDEFSDSPEADRVILEGAGFETGYTRGWLRESPLEFLGVFVFEFSDASGARSARDRFAAQNGSKQDAGRFEVDGVVDAVGVSYTRQVEGEAPERVHAITFVRGARLFQVTGQFSDEQAPVDQTVAFARVEDELAA